ncbi:hypothetical protein [Microbacterium sp. UCD-TDU]|uniref:hypothetical protein n=1 Tax=Microbacterium sp. UCD-TDU TaxID=1247714 RepID=UPI000348556E|nr:hypothetical protein [Microbacterium sp. UCD-TDU]EYT60921.1 hypothetical protein D514_0106320 [Microbacterium sp. UCD-TDU]
MPAVLEFDANARYGAALVGVLFAGYLSVSTDYSAFVQATNYAGVLGTDIPAVDLFEFLLTLGLFVTAFWIFPTSSARRLAAVTLTCVVLFLWATIGIERGVGNVVDPAGLWVFLLDQGLVSLLVGLGGWLIVRARSFATYAVMLVVFIPPIISRALIDSSVTSGSFTLAKIAAVIVLGIGGAWLAALADRWQRPRDSSREPNTPRP